MSMSLVSIHYNHTLQPHLQQYLTALLIALITAVLHCATQNTAQQYLISVARMVPYLESAELVCAV